MGKMYTHAELQDAAASVWVKAWNAAIAREARENTVIGLGAAAGIYPIAESTRWCETFDAAVKDFRRQYPSQAYAIACEKQDKHLKRYKTINELKE